MTKPLVSIICLCYNHAAFVQEALDSVNAQTYSNIELIIVDDASTDNSREKIEEWVLGKPVKVIFFEENVGNCKAFNTGLALARGEYIIDLAADDILLPQRVQVGVEAFTKADKEYGVHFSDAAYIEAKGNFLRNHYIRDRDTGNVKGGVPEGWVYKDLLERYFLCTPTMMMKKEVFDRLGGYDESLAYEDFDFWVRSARCWKYLFTDQVLVKKRIVKGSWSAKQYDLKSKQLETTLIVCSKAKELNRTREEDQALGKRLSYEIRQAIRFANFEMANKMLALKREVSPAFPEDNLYQLFISKEIKLPV